MTYRNSYGCRCENGVDLGLGRHRRGVDQQARTGACNKCSFISCSGSLALLDKGWETVISCLEFVYASRDRRGETRSAVLRSARETIEELGAAHVVLVAVTTGAVMVLSAKVTVLVDLTSAFTTTVSIEVLRYLLQYWDASDNLDAGCVV